jgi:hypothetical protein
MTNNPSFLLLKIHNTEKFLGLELTTKKLSVEEMKKLIKFYRLNYNVII